MRAPRWIAALLLVSACEGGFESHQAYPAPILFTRFATSVSNSAFAADTVLRTRLQSGPPPRKAAPPSRQNGRNC